MFTSLINLFYPPVCAGCDALLLERERIICSQCRHEMPQTHHHLDPLNEAVLKFYGKIPVEFAAAFLHYHKRGTVQEMIANLKYHGMEAIGTVIGSWYGSVLQAANVLQNVDAVVPVPLHARKLRKRGYNQVDAFAQALAEKLNTECRTDLLFRKRYSRTQTRKNRLGRSAVTQGEMFEARPAADDSSKHFLLVDDVLTTGATLESCARALLQIPGIKISIACIAMSRS